VDEDVEFQRLKSLWEEHFHSEHFQKSSIHPPPALSTLIFLAVRAGLTEALVYDNEDEPMSDTQKILITMSSLCHYMIRFGAHLNAMDFDIDTDLTQCHCCELTDYDVRRLLGGN
jgi:hypothetical protein